MIEYIIKYMIKCKHLFVEYLVCMLIEIGLSLWMPVLSAALIDTLTQKSDFDYIFKEVILITFLSFSIILLKCVQPVIFSKLQLKLSFSMNYDIIQHIHRVPIEKIITYDSSYINSRIYKDTNNLGTFGLSFLLPTVFQFVKLSVTLYTIYNIDSSITCYILCMIIIYFVIYILSKGIIYKNELQYKEEENSFFQKLNKQYELIREIKAEADFEQNYKYLNTYFMRKYNALAHKNHTLFIISFIEKNTILIFKTIILFFEITKIFHNDLSLGSYIIVMTYIDISLRAIQYFLDYGNSYQNAKSSYFRILELINIPIEHNGAFRLSKVDYIDLCNISYKYTNSGQIFNNLSLHLSKGKMYALTGRNGIGKTTLINIIAGLYSISEGCIKYNGIDMNNIDMYYFRQKCLAVVFQKIRFSENIKNELVINRVFDDNQNILESFFDFDFCEKLLEKDVDELSGGEVQKIALVKALAKEAQLVILDEPTSNLDKKRKKKLMNYLLEKKENQCILIVTHDDDILECVDYVINLEGV